MVSLTSRTAKSDNVNLLASRNEETIDYNNLTYEKKSLVNKMVENRVNNVENTLQEFSDLSPDEFEILNELSHNRFQALLLKQKYASTLLTQIAKSPAVSGAISITGELVDAKTGMNLTGSRVLLTDEFGEILKITQTNEDGKFRFTEVQSEAKLFLRLENTTGHQVNARVQNIALMGSEKATASYVENVYFDFDHYLIRPEAAQVLGELADYLQRNPGAQVEIYAFADDRGSNSYNFELTQKRGEAVVAYLTRYGVDATSLAIIPKGKDMKRSATEAQRQYNRRAEFYINGVRENFSPSVKTYILKKGVDWSYISKETGIPREDLQALNGSKTEDVKAFQPVRLPINASGISEDLFFVGM
jgi:outer membrane protein OmpA-like peptidoglycan-associated protein